MGFPFSSLEETIEISQRPCHPLPCDVPTTRLTSVVIGTWTMFWLQNRGQSGSIGVRKGLAH